MKQIKKSEGNVVRESNNENIIHSEEHKIIQPGVLVPRKKLTEKELPLEITHGNREKPGACESHSRVRSNHIRMNQTLPL